ALLALDAPDRGPPVAAVELVPLAVRQVHDREALEAVGVAQLDEGPPGRVLAAASEVHEAPRPGQRAHEPAAPLVDGRAQVGVEPRARELLRVDERPQEDVAGDHPSTEPAEEVPPAGLIRGPAQQEAVGEGDECLVRGTPRAATV